MAISPDRFAATSADEFHFSPNAIYLASLRAPKGGATIGGKMYEGGMFIPGAELAKATPEEKEELKKKIVAQDKAKSAAAPPPKAVDPARRTELRSQLGINTGDMDERDLEALDEFERTGNRSLLVDPVENHLRAEVLGSAQSKVENPFDEYDPDLVNKVTSQVDDPKQATVLVAAAHETTARKSVRNLESMADDLEQRGLPKTAARTRKLAEATEARVEQIGEKARQRRSADDADDYATSRFSGLIDDANTRAIGYIEDSPEFRVLARQRILQAFPDKPRKTLSLSPRTIWRRLKSLVTRGADR